MTRTIKAKVVNVQGICNAELQLGDIFFLEALRITPRGHTRECALAYASLTANAGRLAINPQGLCVSCPDPGTGQGGNVIFRLWVERRDTD
jgi:uncharacterized repeat protein (TIGR04076 family)